MRQSQMMILLVAALLMVVCLTLVPFGFSDYEEVTIFVNNPKLLPETLKKSQEWQFVGYAFVLGSHKPRLREPLVHELLHELAPGVTVLKNPDLRIGWHVVAIEMFTVAALTGVVLLLLTGTRAR